MHGCGEQAHRAEQKKWKETQNAAVPWTSTGLAGAWFGVWVFDMCERCIPWMCHPPLHNQDQDLSCNTETSHMKKQPEV